MQKQTNTKYFVCLLISQEINKPQIKINLLFLNFWKPFKNLTRICKSGFPSFFLVNSSDIMLVNIWQNSRQEDLI